MNFLYMQRNTTQVRELTLCVESAWFSLTACQCLCTHTDNLARRGLLRWCGPNSLRL